MTKKQEPKMIVLHVPNGVLQANVQCPPCPIVSVQLSQRHILTGLGTDPMSQWGIVVERFAISGFVRS
jgi:hypothetical protein